MKIIIGFLAAVAAIAPAGAANFVTNGSFEDSSYTSNTQFGAGYGGQGVTGWTGAGGNHLQFYFFGGTQATTNAVNQFGDSQGYFRDNFSVLSPDGGNFVALDGDINYNGQLSQTLTGLTAGKNYTVSFSWAASQLRNRTGATTEQLVVGFGSATQATSVVAVPSEGFRGWFKEKFNFTADGASQVLSFLSVGTPAGLPPIAALDGVSVTAVPEPSSWAMLLVGFGLIGLGVRSRTRNAVSA